MRLEVGETATWQRTFTVEDVRRFAELTGDRGAHHVEPGPDGRVMVQGLLTASVPTKIGGDISFMAQQTSLEFARPVFTGDTVRADVRVLEVERVNGRAWLTLEVVCRNQDGKDVLRGSIRGFVSSA